tara:strand:- start:2474 stop:3661 length:1188 start_codon:yes stop_codon:yes gene_type:complete
MTEVLNVKYLSNFIKNHVDLLADRYIWIEGEIQNYRNSSRHQYFTLNEGDTSIKAIIWESIFKGMKIKLKNGLFGKFYAKINYYKNKNEISVNIYKVDLEKEVGEIYRLYEENKEKCEEKGYLDKIKNIPEKFKNIAIITRYESAAYNDIINVLKECLSMNIYVYDSGMQGDSSIGEITKALEVLNKVRNKLKLDCIIITRGGGSIDDLWIFNDWDIITSIYGSKVPIFTGIGHNIDHSLSDEISDKSFITPTDIGRYIESSCSKKEFSSKLCTNRDMIQDKIDILIQDRKDEIRKIVNKLTPEYLLRKFSDEHSELDRYRSDISKRIRDMIDLREKELENLQLSVKNIIDERNSIKLLTKSGAEIIEECKIKINSRLQLIFNKKVFKIKVLSIE